MGGSDLDCDNQPGKPCEALCKQKVGCRRCDDHSCNRDSRGWNGSKPHQCRTEDQAENENQNSFCPMRQPDQPVSTKEVEEPCGLDFDASHEYRSSIRQVLA